MNSAHMIKVYFTLIQFALTLSISGLGTVALNPLGGSYVSGTVVTMTAVPATDYSFTGWSGDLTGTTNPATLTMNGNKTVTATFTPNSTPTYTVAIEGSNYVARNSAGTAVATNTDFGAMWNSLNTKLVSGDVIVVGSGTYNAKTMITLSKDHITVNGVTGAILKNTSGNTDSRLISINGNYVTLNNISFDDGLVLGEAAMMIIYGNYDTVTNCSLTNCGRYGFTSMGPADHFSFLNNHVYKAQYGFSTDDYGATSTWSTNGLIKGNVITGCSECCIKLKMAKNVLVTGNSCDICGPSDSSDGCIGICYYHNDTPTQNVTTSYNTIWDSTNKSNKGIGILVDPDIHLDWPSCPYPAFGMKILHNTVKNKWYGMIIEGNGAEADYNDCSAATAWGIRIDGNNNVLIGNLGSIQNNGSGNTIN